MQHPSQLIVAPPPSSSSSSSSPQSSSSSSSSSSFDLPSYISRYDSHSETHLQRLLHIGRYFHFHSNDTITISGGCDVVGGGVSSCNSSSSSSSSSSIAKQAFELAIAHMKQSGNFHRYLEEYGAAMPITTGESSSSSSTSMGTELAASSSNTTSLSPQRQQLQQQHHDNDEVSTHHHHHHPHHNQHTVTPHPLIIQHYIPTYDSSFIYNSKQMAQNKIEILEGRLAVAQSKLMKESIRVGLLALAMFHREIGELKEAWRRVVRSR